MRLKVPVHDPEFLMQAHAYPMDRGGYGVVLRIKEQDHIVFDRRQPFETLEEAIRWARGRIFELLHDRTEYDIAPYDFVTDEWIANVFKRESAAYPHAQLAGGGRS